MKARFITIFLSKTQAQWCDIMEGSDVCFAPVLNLEESIHHPHNVARNTFVEVAGVYQPAPAPRFDKTPCEISKPPSASGEDTQAILNDWGFDHTEIKRLLENQAIKQT